MDQLSNEARELKNEYLRQWRKANKEKVREHQNAYWEKKANINDVTAPVTAPVTVTAPVSVIGNTCIVCGKSFNGKRADSKYCSPACKQKYHRVIKRNEK